MGEWLRHAFRTDLSQRLRWRPVEVGSRNVLRRTAADGQSRHYAKTTVAAWHDKPTWYVVSTEDRTINSDQERFMANRLHAQTIEVKAGHLVLISRPTEVADLIIEATGAKK